MSIRNEIIERLENLAEHAVIMEMQEFSDFTLPRFIGSTKGEASDYIDRWSKRAHEAFDFGGHGDNYGDRI